MPINKSSFVNFYLGNGAEYHLMSELFLHGYEANKMSPDIGIDILVTNKALQYYKKAKSKTFYLQVKSTFLIDDVALFFIKNDELKFLLSDPTIISVFCYYIPRLEADPQSLNPDNSDTHWWSSEEASWMRYLYETAFKEIKKRGKLDSIKFKGFDLKYFWLNNAQLKRAKSEGVFTSSSIDNLVKLTIKACDYDVSIEPVGALCPEIQNISSVRLKVEQI